MSGDEAAWAAQGTPLGRRRCLPAVPHAGAQPDPRTKGKARPTHSHPPTVSEPPPRWGGSTDR